MNENKASFGDIILAMFKESISLAIVVLGTLAVTACYYAPGKVDIIISSAISAIAGLATGRALGL